MLNSLYIKEDVKGFLKNLICFWFLLGGEKKQFDDS